MPDDNHEVMTPAEAADLLRVPPGTLSQWRARRQGPPFCKVGRHVRYRRSDVLAWLDEQTHRARAS